MGSLLFTATAMRRDANARRMGDLLAITAQHRDLWKEIQARPELGRIMKSDVDLLTNPISIEEQEFLNLVFVHFYTGWVMVRNGSHLSMESYARDVRDFLSLPVPREVWEETKKARDTHFIRFVEECLKEA